MLVLKTGAVGPGCGLLKKDEAQGCCVGASMLGEGNKVGLSKPFGRFTQKVCKLVADVRDRVTLELCCVDKQVVVIDEQTGEEKKVNKHFEYLYFGWYYYANGERAYLVIVPGKQKLMKVITPSLMPNIWIDLNEGDNKKHNDNQEMMLVD